MPRLAAGAALELEVRFDLLLLPDGGPLGALLLPLLVPLDPPQLLLQPPLLLLHVLLHLVAGVYNVSYPPPLGDLGLNTFRGKFIKSVGEDCEEKRGISWLWGRIKRGKKGRGKQYNLSYNIKPVAKNIKWGKGKI